MGKGDGSGCGAGCGSGTFKGKFERTWFPAMPLPAAIVCCVLNFLVPGLGTAIAGLTVFCCARTEDMDGSAKVVSCCASCGIGFLQLLTTVLFFVGWFWSCFWGATFIMMSIEYYHNNKVDEYDPGTAVEINVHTTHVVYQNGSSNPSAVIVQPNFVPFHVVQTGNQNNIAGVATKQPVASQQNVSAGFWSSTDAPPPYPGASTSGVAPPVAAPSYDVNPSGSLFPEPPNVMHADGNESKLAMP